MSNHDEMSVFASTIMRNKYAHTKGDGTKESWSGIASRVATEVVKPYLPELAGPIQELIEQRKFIPGGRYCYAAGRRFPQVNSCFLLTVEDSREGWGNLMNRATNALMTGGGIGIVYSRLREENAPIQGMGGKSTGPCALMQMVNESGRHIIQGGSRRSAIWAGLIWNHPDIFKFIHLKKWDEHTVAGKKINFNYPAPMDMTNMSVIYDTAFFRAYSNPNNRDHVLAHRVYWESVISEAETGDPGASIDCDENEGENLRNACTEVTSADDNDMCNLGSINLSRIKSLEEMQTVTELSTAFLVCGTLYSKLPLDVMYRIREKNRRLGLGLMGLHEFLLKRGKRYGPDVELGEYLSEYARSGAYANRFCDRLSISRSCATRSVAPNGTISIVAETTSSAEPIFAVAQRRRYLDGHQWKAQYIVDPTAHRLIQQGVSEELIEDSLTLSTTQEGVKRRIEFQAWLQEYVDHGISSTINLPRWGSDINNPDTVKDLGESMINLMPRLRGITAYPDGGRDGQPLTRVDYKDAIKHLGVEFEDGSENSCKNGVCSA